jgi:hypothetical protein
MKAELAVDGLRLGEALAHVDHDVIQSGQDFRHALESTRCDRHSAGATPWSGVKARA